MKKMKVVMMISLVAVAMTLILMIPIPVRAQVLESSEPCSPSLKTIANLSESMNINLQERNASFTFEYQGSNITLWAEYASVVAVSKRVVGENYTMISIKINLKDAQISSNMFNAYFGSLKLDLEVNVTDNTVNYIVEAMTNMPLIQALAMALQNTGHT